MTRNGASARIGFVGLGTMGAPMVRCLVKAGMELCLYDIDATATSSLAGETRARGAADPGEVGRSCGIVILMLPNSDIVRTAVLGTKGSAGLAESLAPGSIVIDMSSSYPMATRSLGATLAEMRISLLDAPVSGGLRKAIAGTLAIMLGGADESDMQRAEPVLAPMGKVFRTGGLGSGHATKALNNYVSAAGLAAACEAVVVGRSFGLDPATMIDVINASTGRNNATENKIKQFVLNEDYATAGFSLELMAKDVKAAADLSEELGHALPGVAEARALWQKADKRLGKGADHTEIYRFLDGKPDKP